MTLALRLKRLESSNLMPTSLESRVLESFLGGRFSVTDLTNSMRPDMKLYDTAIDLASLLD